MPFVCVCVCVCVCCVCIVLNYILGFCNIESTPNFPIGDNKVHFNCKQAFRQQKSANQICLAICSLSNNQNITKAN